MNGKTRSKQHFQIDLILFGIVEQKLYEESNNLVFIAQLNEFMLLPCFGNNLSQINKGGYKGYDRRSFSLIPILEVQIDETPSLLIPKRIRKGS